MKNDNKSDTGKPKRICCRAGNVFCVEIEGLHKRYFQYLGTDHTMLGGSLIRVFKKRYPMDYQPVINDIISDEVDFYNYTWVSLGVKWNDWYRVGKSSDLGDLSSIFFIHALWTKGYSEKWELHRAFTQGDIYIGKLPAKYQVLELDGVAPPDWLIKQLTTGYLYQRGVGKFFRTREPLSVDDMDRKHNIDSKACLSEINENAIDIAQKNDFGWYCEVTTWLEETTTDGLPTADEQRVLDKLEEILDYIVKGPDLDNPEGAYIGHRIGNGLLVSAWMVHDSEKVSEKFKAYIHADRYLRNFEFRFERDDAWQNATSFINRT